MAGVRRWFRGPLYGSVLRGKGRCPGMSLRRAPETWLSTFWSPRGPKGRVGEAGESARPVLLCKAQDPAPRPPGVSPAHTASLWGTPVVFLRSEGSGLCSLYIFRVCFSCFSFESSWCPTSLVVHVLRCHYFLIRRETKCKLEGISTSCSHENCNRRAFDLWMRQTTRNGVSDFLRSQLILPK